jgi:hypothetical protein
MAACKKYSATKSIASIFVSTDQKWRKVAKLYIKIIFLEMRLTEDLLGDIFVT